MLDVTLSTNSGAINIDTISNKLHPTAIVAPQGPPKNPAAALPIKLPAAFVAANLVAAACTSLSPPIKRILALPKSLIG